jgi:Domain of unknown function (DUF4129)
VGLLDELPIPSNDPGAERDLADEILSRPEYRDPPQSLWDRINEAIGEFVGDLLSLVGFGGGSVAPIVAWLVMALLVGGLGWLLWWAISSGRWTEGRARRRDEGDPVIVATDAYRSARDWRSEAEAHEAAGRWRPALRCRYRALVADLAARGLVEEVPGRTAGEYRRQVDAVVPEVAPAFAGATSLFEGAWYGGRSTGAEEAARFRELEARVLSGVS